MKHPINEKLLFAGVFFICANCCFAQVVRQEGDEFLQKKIVLVNTENKSVSFKLNFKAEPDVSVWPTYTIKGHDKKIYEMEKYDRCFIVLGELKKILRRGKTYSLYFDLKNNNWEIVVSD